MRYAKSSAAVPALRFKGFYDEFSVKSIGDIDGRWFKGQAFSKSEITEAGINKCIHYGELFTLYAPVILEVISCTNSDIQARGRAGDLLFPASDVTPDGLGRCCALLVDDILLGGDMICLRQHEIVPQYLSYAIIHNKQQIINQVTGTTVRHSTAKKIQAVEVYLPISANEQEKIGNVLNSVDVLISSRTAGVKKLEELKKSMLVKMFPQGDSFVPEIRFKEFKGKWEKKRFAEYLTVSVEDNRSDEFGREDVLSVSGEFGVVNQIEHLGRSFAGASVANYHVARKGQVIYTKSPLKANPFGIIKTNKGADGIVSVLYGVYDANENCDQDFVQVYFESDARLNNYLRPLVNKGAKNTLQITDETALDGMVMFPEVEEQRKIAAYFRALDDLLAARKAELKKLREMKSALLERMFV